MALPPSVAKIVKRDICDLWVRETDIPEVATSAFSVSEEAVLSSRKLEKLSLKENKAWRRTGLES